MKGRTLGVDFGMARIGLAMSDPGGMLASALETIHWKGRDMEKALLRCEELCRIHEIKRIVVGLPLREDGREGEICEPARSFGNQLSERTDIPILFRNERYTSKIAAEYLRSAQYGKNKRNKKAIIDQAAACVILQDYLDEL